jgi:hypothetical protein
MQSGTTHVLATVLEYDKTDPPYAAASQALPRVLHAPAHTINLHHTPSRRCRVHTCTSPGSSPVSALEDDDGRQQRVDCARTAQGRSQGQARGRDGGRARCTQGQESREARSCRRSSCRCDARRAWRRPLYLCNWNSRRGSRGLVQHYSRRGSRGLAYHHGSRRGSRGLAHNFISRRGSRGLARHFIGSRGTRELCAGTHGTRCFTERFGRCLDWLSCAVQGCSFDERDAGCHRLDAECGRRQCNRRVGAVAP